VRGRLGYAIGPAEFDVERYLEHQGMSFVRRFDANSLIYLSKAIDHFDLSEGDVSLEAALAPTQARFLLLTFSSDWLYPPYQLERAAQRLRAAGRPVEYHCLKSDYGHDAFLLEHARQEPIVRQFLRPDRNLAVLRHPRQARKASGGRAEAGAAI
jgi:homoserine O-acetyltransferase